jgi:hypothetical protein
MKYILVLLFLVAGPAMAQRKCLRKFYREQRREYCGETFKIGLGRFTMKFASWIIPKDAMEEEGIPLKHLLSKVYRLKLYTISGDSRDSVLQTASIQRLQKRLIEKEHFEPLIDVRHQGSVVHLLNKGSGDDIGNLILLVQDEHDFVILHLNTSLKMQDVNELVQQLAKN